ncbi:unnamed protein product, partial [Aureobasidium uvarum]
MITPLVVIIDRAIVEQSSSKRPMLQCLRLHFSNAMKRPSRFVLSRPFGIVWTLYAATYIVANTSETFASTRDNVPIGSVVLASTCLVNVPLGVWKDVRFAQLFGVGKASVIAGAAASTHTAKVGRTPISAAATFLARDTLTLFGSFTLAPWLSASLPEVSLLSSQAQAVLTQLTVPALTQIGATPLHLLGLDLCNRPYRMSWRERMIQIRYYLLSTTMVRCVRILPAFGFGCLTNTALREYLHGDSGLLTGPNGDI